MNDENQERTGRGLINLLLIIIIIAGIVFALWRVGIISSPKPTEPTTLVPENEEAITTVSMESIQTTLQAQQTEIKQLRADIQQLQTEIQKLKKAQTTKSVTTTSKQTTANSTATTPAASIEGDANAVTLVSYTHGWLEENAKLSLKNNTNNTITRISARISYYDMSGNMLDYRDITKNIKIEPQMSRSIQIPGFGIEEHYAYYKSDTFYSEQRKYKVQFKLQSYAIAP